MDNNGKKKPIKMACGHMSDKAWLVTAPEVLHPAFQQLGANAKIGLQLVQCTKCKLLLDIRLVISPLEQKRVVPASEFALRTK